MPDQKAEPEDWIEGYELKFLFTALELEEYTLKISEMEDKIKSFLRKKRAEDMEKSWYRSWECAQSVYKSENVKREVKATGFKIKDLLEFKKREGIQ